MKFNKINPNNSRLNSYQFQLSQKIFGKRISLNLNRDEAAKLTGLSLSTYTEVEQGIDLESSEKKYQQVLNKLSSFSRKRIKIKEIDNKTLQHKTSKVIAKMKINESSNKQKTLSFYQVGIKKSVFQPQMVKK